MDFVKLLAGQENLIVLICAFIIGGAFKSRNIFSPVFAALTTAFRSKRSALMAVSILGGVLPIEGRVTVSAPILDSLSKESHCDDHPHGHSTRGKLGVLDYVATHHYYLWSPLEKTIILSMATLGLTYAQVISYTLIPLILYFAFLTFVVYGYMQEDEIVLSTDSSTYTRAQVLQIVPFLGGLIGSIFFPPYYVFPAVALYYVVTANVKPVELVSFVKWKTVIAVAVIIAAANAMKMYEGTLMGFIKTFADQNWTTAVVAAVIGAAISFMLGSSGKFAGIAAGLTLIFGIQYFPLFFMADYAAYLLSPTHKCLGISTSYFNTRISEIYKWVGALALLMLASSGLVMLVH